MVVVELWGCMMINYSQPIMLVCDDTDGNTTAWSGLFLFASGILSHA
jgi:hypothetical protein